jgi:hypothetical protein
MAHMGKRGTNCKASFRDESGVRVANLSSSGNRLCSKSQYSSLRRFPPCAREGSHENCCLEPLHARTPSLPPPAFAAPTNHEKADGKKLFALPWPHPSARDCVLPIDHQVPGKAIPGRSVLISTPQRCGSGSFPRAASNLLSTPSEGPMCRNTSRIKTLRDLLTRLDNARKNRIVIQNSTLPGLCRSHGHGRHKRNDARDGFAKIS